MMIRKLKNVYTFGNREFGIGKLAVYREIMVCPFCNESTKKIPNAEMELLEAEEKRNERKQKKLEGSGGFDDNDDDDDFFHDSGQTSAKITPIGLEVDWSNESRNIDIRDAPISMIMDTPKSEAIWYNQQGLAEQNDLFSKFLGVIVEMGVDMGLAVQGDDFAQVRLTTKMYCADRLVGELKKRAISRELLANSDFYADYRTLEETYLNIGRLDLFLYDVNIMVMTFNLASNAEFMNTVNQSIRKFVSKMSAEPLSTAAKAISMHMSKMMNGDPDCQQLLDVLPSMASPLVSVDPTDNAPVMQHWSRFRPV